MPVMRKPPSRHAGRRKASADMMSRSLVAWVRSGLVLAGLGTVLLWSVAPPAAAQQPQELPETRVTASRIEAPSEPTPPEPPAAKPFSPLEQSGRTLPVENLFTSPQSASQGLITQRDLE